MPITSDFQNGILILSVFGESPRGHIVDMLIEAYSDPRFTSATAVLIDARGSKANPCSADLREYAQRAIARRPLGHRGKWAVLVGGEPVKWGLGRMGALTFGSLGVDMEVFTEMDAALGYLKPRQDQN